MTWGASKGPPNPPGRSARRGGPVTRLGTRVMVGLERAQSEALVFCGGLAYGAR